MTKSNRTTTGRAARELRQESAADRLKERVGRSDEQQLKLIVQRPGVSARETARLRAS